MDSSSLTQRIAELGDRVNGHPEHVAEVVPQLVALLGEHDDPRVLVGIIDALGCAWDESANLAMLRFMDHPDPQVRFAATCALPGGTDTASGTEQVAAALIRLTTDEDDAVRDWATFGLGSILQIDNDEVRAALFARLSDASDDVRDEAVAGIARRRDPRAVAIVADFLAEDVVGPLVFEAAEFLGDPRIYDALLRWHRADPDRALVQWATQSCDPDYQRARTERHAALLTAVERIIAERGSRSTAYMYCDRGDVEVLLAVTAKPSWAWDADRLIERASGDVDAAESRVVSDLEAESD